MFEVGNTTVETSKEKHGMVYLLAACEHKAQWEVQEE